MYERFELLLKQHGLTAYRVAKETGITTVTLTNWKKGKYTPKRDKMEILANFFGVSVDFLYGNTDSPEEDVSDFIGNTPSLRVLENETDSVVAQKALMLTLLDHYNITRDEIELIMSFRKADVYDKITVLRTLKLKDEFQYRIMAYYKKFTDLLNKPKEDDK